MENVRRLLDLQSGVIARQQLVADGQRDHDIRRMVRRRELVPMRRGVYLNHTGEATWLQLAWSAVLATSSFDSTGDAEAACLCHHSALLLLNGPGGRRPAGHRFHILVEESRTPTASGLIVHRSNDFGRRCLPRYPPHVSYADAALDVAASSRDRGEALAVLARAVGDRHTTARHLLELSRTRTRVRGRAWLERVLADIDEGTCSVLEHGFLNEVVRAHGLPTPHLQRREVTAIGVVYRDATYTGVNVELDGRMFHGTFDRRDADMERDLVAATMGQRTVRLGWGQVFQRPCRTAAALASLIGAKARRCRKPTCAVSVTW